MNEIKARAEAGDRVLVTTLTKKMAEDLTAYLLEYGIKVRYLHSEIDTLERIQIVRDLRLGEYDVLVGVNLLREGLDLPEVSLVAILDADKEGFLRGETSLVQTIGRAARNVNGRVLMYADRETDAMRAAIGETDRRRAIQRRLQRGARDHPGDGPQGDLRDDRVPGDGGPGAAQAPPQARRGVRRPGRAGAHDRRARGGDARRRRRPPLRGGRPDPRRAEGAAPRPRRDAGRRLSAGGCEHRGVTICEEIAGVGGWAAAGDLPPSVRERAELQAMSIAAGRAAGESAAAPFAAVAPDGPVGEVYRSAAASIAHDWDDYLFMGHTGHSAVPAAAAFAADPERALLAQVAANEVAGRLGAALFLGPHNGQFWASIHCASAAVAASVGLGLDARAHRARPGDRPLPAALRDVARVHGPEEQAADRGRAGGGGRAGGAAGGRWRHRRARRRSSTRAASSPASPSRRGRRCSALSAASG